MYVITYTNSNHREVNKPRPAVGTCNWRSSTPLLIVENILEHSSKITLYMYCNLQNQGSVGAFLNPSVVSGNPLSI